MGQSYGKAGESDWWKARAGLSSHSGSHLLRFTGYWSHHHPHWWRITPVLLSFQPFVLFHYKHCTHSPRGEIQVTSVIYLYFLPHTFKGYATFKMRVANQFKREKVNGVNFKHTLRVNIPSWRRNLHLSRHYSQSPFTHLTKWRQKHNKRSRSSKYIFKKQNMFNI